uniref:Immunoglobulin domain-containing protein n=1 Tax=Laticauda laticaudata TaxID=8630 RepID=A0A8C5SQZ5_LATLA
GLVLRCSQGSPTAQGGEISLLVSQPNINSSVAENVLLSVAYTGETSPMIEWKHTSASGTTKIAEWKSGVYANISSSYKDRVNIYDNGSLQLLKVDFKDSGYYLVTVRDELGIILYGTILLNVYEAYLCWRSSHGVFLVIFLEFTISYLGLLQNSHQCALFWISVCLIIYFCDLKLRLIKQALPDFNIRFGFWVILRDYGSSHFDSSHPFNLFLIFVCLIIYFCDFKLCLIKQ